MSSPQFASKHHFIPKFLLRKWQDDSGRLWVYKRSDGGGISLRKGAPKSVAYVENLYTIRPEHKLSKPASDEIETEIMGRLDDQAAIIHKAILDRGLDSITLEDRYMWSVFIASIIERSPQRLQMYKEQASVQEVIKELNGLYPGAEALVDRFGFDIDAVVNNTVLNFMVDRVLNSDLACDIYNMQWLIVQNNIPGEHFVLGDHALVINNASAVDEPLYFLRIAIAPDKLMLFAYNQSALDDDFISTLAATYNIMVVEASLRYIIASRELVDGQYTKFSRILNEMHRI
ncbi:DUF4238 domain-containing protein [Pseudomonas sp. RP23018S]|uniref:DUF4238 domain-containing protein n=1 Tax=Pseudomonas sp. RP23018S TaxID=3096037 RepID=UPI002ACADBF8|nr:DUF4238 domain-containing protein [Pseudomonas sp. RP23018S]MDZ5602298.1 DUF4238 domain-containing protein [Pseudomonas sp. RP23018S]